MLGLGTRVIVAEYALGIVLPSALRFFSGRAELSRSVQVGWQTISGLWLIDIVANYIPMLIDAVLIAKDGTVKEEEQLELSRKAIWHSTSNSLNPPVRRCSYSPPRKQQLFWT